MKKLISKVLLMAVLVMVFTAISQVALAMPDCVKNPDIPACHPKGDPNPKPPKPDPTPKPPNPNPADTTKPTITITTPADGASYQKDQTLIADYTCVDSGPLTGDLCQGTNPVGQQIDTSTVGEHSFTVTAKNKVGTTNKTVRYKVVDDPGKAPPTITITTPADGASYKVGDDIKADYKCVDGNGVAITETPITGPAGARGCLGLVKSTSHVYYVGSPIDTSKAGSYDFFVKADDGNGNTATATSHYTVVDKSDDSGDPGNSGDPGDPGDTGNPGDLSDIGDIVGGILPDTGGGWAILLLSGGALIGGGGFLVRRFSR